MELISRESFLWGYLESDIRGLIADGELLFDLVEEKDKGTTDFSYLVFSFSKAYEGFLKKLFLDMQIINEKDYYGDDVRIGRILSPKYREDHHEVFDKSCLENSAEEDDTGKDLGDRLWETWHRGRNRVFHYFPHNFRRLSYTEALDIVRQVVSQMEEAVRVCCLE